MSDLFSRFGRVLRGLGSRASDVDPDEVVKAWRQARQAQREAEGQQTEWEQTRERARRHARSSGSGLSTEVERAYANLELTPPADLDQAKAAWRELMRKYHPDKHQGDPKKTELANKVAARLTEAYRLVKEHLEA